MQPALLIALIATSYLLLAGAPAWSRAPIWAVAILAAAIAPRRTFAFPRFTRALDLALIGILAAMTLQLIPLPAALVSLISPNAQSLHSETRLTFGASAGWLPLSIDRTATVEALSTMGLAVTAFWIARAVFGAGGFTRHFCRILGWLAAIAAVVAIMQRTVRPGLLMGVVVSSARNANPLGPFLNRNHFAGWLLLASAASAGYLIAHLQIHPSYRQRFRIAFKHFLSSGGFLSGVCAIVTVTALLMTLSRSAAAGLGAAAIAGGWLGRPRLTIERNRLPAILGAIGVVLLVLVTFVDLSGWLTRFQQSVGIADSDFDRITIWRESLPMIRDFPLTGTGAGTYGQAMSHYQQSRFWIGSMHGWAFFNNAHSHYVQLLAEGGLLLLVPTAAAIWLLARLGLESIRSDKGEMFWVRIGAAAGLVGIAVQSIWEVALLMPANAILCGALAALLIYRRDGSRPPTTRDLRPA